MRTLLSWILMAAGIACIGAGANAGYFNKDNDLHDYSLYIMIGGAVLAVVGFVLAREAKVAQHTTMMLQQKQKRNYQILIRLIVVAAALAAGYFLIELR
jgi:hypothetical protein